jgi:hypothetical protein
MALLKSDPPPPMLMPFIFAAISVACWYFSGPKIIMYITAGLAAFLTLCDVMIFIGTGGRNE